MANRILKIAGLTASALLIAACAAQPSAPVEGVPAGNGDESPAAAVLTTITPGSLTTCADIPYPPFEIEEPSAPTGYSGFDIEIVGAISVKLGLTLVVKDVDFDALQSGTVLAAGECDLGTSAITITEERKANIDFADPYY
ncbi:MAG: transporter substrate-binding domain-containing protein, partial [Propionibacteriaceae bacterium]|nr:transporter substrate-binding domain-containing protein [Propionibacteriaceae bacterium]